MQAGNGGPKVGKNSPVGDLGKKDNAEFAKFFGRKIKNAGAEISASSVLKVRPFQKANDYNS